MARPVLESTSAESSASGTSVSFNSGTYSGASTDDYLVVFVVTQEDSQAVTGPAGWTKVNEALDNGTWEAGVSCFVLPAGTAKSGTYTFTFSSCTYQGGAICVVSGSNLEHNAGTTASGDADSTDVLVAGFGAGSADRLALASTNSLNNASLTVDEGIWSHELSYEDDYAAVYSYAAGTGSQADVDTGINDAFAWSGVSLTLEEGSTPEASPDNLSVSVSIEEPSLSTTPELAPSDLAVAVALETPSLTTVPVLVPDNLVVSVSLETPTLTTTTVLAPNNLAVGVSLETSALTTVPVLGPDNLGVAVSLEQPGLTLAPVFGPDSLGVSVTIEQPTLSAGNLNPNDLAVSVSLETPSLATTPVLAPDNLAVSVALQAPSLTTVPVLTPNNLSVSVTLEQPSVSTDAVAAPDDLSVAVTFEQPTLSVTTVLAPDSLAVAVSIGNPTITLSPTFDPNDLSVTVAIQNPTIPVASSFTQYVLPGAGTHSRIRLRRGGLDRERLING